MGMRLLPISCSLLSCWCIVSFFSSTSPFDRRRLALNCAHTERVCSCFFLVFSNSVFNIFTSSSTFIFAIPTSLTWLASDRDSTSNSSLSLNTSAVEERKASSSRAVLLKFSSIDFAFLSTMSFSTCASRRWPFITLMSCDSRSTSRFHPCISSPSLTPIAAFSFLLFTKGRGRLRELTTPSFCDSTVAAHVRTHTYKHRNSHSEVHSTVCLHITYDRANAKNHSHAPKHGRGDNKNMRTCTSYRQVPLAPLPSSPQHHRILLSFEHLQFELVYLLDCHHLLGQRK
mmetsp:Transcript_6556/g.16268  ORF Transcript_6556/g.16268 Transcript_6556/m.16268 type:complete len:286 (-) Transcript_6556:1206-2063(-)